MINSEEKRNYLIITPACNEEAFIAKTINSVVSQTVRPILWVIVNDGSTDRTREIVESYLGTYKFIKLLNLECRGERNFARKATAFGRGVAEAQDVHYELIGNLDADMTVEPDYFQSLIQQFDADPKLGIAGGIVFTKSSRGFSTYDKTLDSVGGAVQLFRKACFEAVGGYPLLPYGGIDAAAEITAKMMGWKVRKFPKLKALEHRRTGTAQTRPMRARHREGQRFYSLGYGALFYFARCVYRAKDPPFIIGSIAAFCGFMDSLIRRRPILLPPDVVSYLRTEQMKRLKRLTATLL